MKKKKGNFTTLLLILVLLAGLSLLLYPSVSDYWNSFHQTRAIATYAEEVANLNQDQYDEIWAAAESYNASLTDRVNAYLLSDAQKEEYQQLLNVSGLGVMGYIEIPSIDCSLPIYHGTDPSILNHACGHIQGSSFPIAGKGTHAAISAHRGLPSAKLFTNLDQLEVGDTFTITVLDRVLTYEVDKISIVLPTETDELKIAEGKDYVTLMTCTPYGINTHRLLVRGRRVETPDQYKHLRVTAEALKIEPIIVAPIMALPMLLILLIGMLLSTRKPKKTRGEKHEKH